MLPSDGSIRMNSLLVSETSSTTMSAPPGVTGKNSSITDVLNLMLENKISSVFVGDSRDISETGIITERDILRVISSGGPAALSQAASSVANSPLISVDESEFVYKAISTMSSNRIRHLAVNSASGEIVGALGVSDLLRQRSQDAYILDDGIEEDRSGIVHFLVYMKIESHRTFNMSSRNSLTNHYQQYTGVL